MKQKKSADLVNLMALSPRDFTLKEIYKIVCRPPHDDALSVEELHSRLSRHIGAAKAGLKQKGFVLVLGELRHSYRAVKRKR